MVDPKFRAIPSIFSRATNRRKNEVLLNQKFELYLLLPLRHNIVFWSSSGGLSRNVIVHPEYQNSNRNNFINLID